MIKLIGLSGQLQNGKDTVADLILKLTSKYDVEISEPISDWHTRRFAGVLKKATAMILGCDLADLEKDSFKNTPLGEEWRVYPLTYKDVYGEHRKLFMSEDELESWIENEKPLSIDDIEDSYVLTPRLILQLLGTEGGREVIHPNIWINATIGNLKPEDRAIVTDVRFPNEVEGIKKKGGIVIRVVRPSKISTSTHPSETSLNDYKDWDYIITNDGTLEELEQKVITMLEHFGIEHYSTLTLR